MARIIPAFVAFAVTAGAAFAGSCDAAFELRVWGGGNAAGSGGLKIEDFDAAPLLTGADVRKSKVTTGVGGAPAVAIRLSATAARRLSEATATRIGEPMAFVHQGVILSAPIVRERIGTGQFLVTGDFDLAGAESLKAAIADCDAGQE